MSVTHSSTNGSEPQTDPVSELSDDQVDDILGINDGRRLRQQGPLSGTPDAVFSEVSVSEPEEVSDMGHVQAWLEGVADALNGADPKLRALVRDEVVTKLGGVERVNAPGRLADSFLQGGADPGEDTGQGTVLALEDPEPVDGPVDGEDVLSDLRDTFERFLMLPKGASTALSLWTLHAHAHGAASVSPVLAITSPEKRCGKTTLLEVLGALVPRPLPASNITAAALFRSVEKYEPTLLVDEADTYLKRGSELRGVLNSGHSKRSAYIVRTVGDDHEPRTFKTWGPKAVALIGSLPDTLEDRAVEVRMRRKTPDENVDRVREDRLEALESLRRRAWTWAQGHAEDIAQADPDLPGQLHDRSRQNWRTLISVAETAAANWPAAGREAAIRLESGGPEEDPSDKIMLLRDLEKLFEERGTDRLRTKEILDALKGMEERPWPEYNHGKPISARHLADLLKPFDVSSRQIRFEAGTYKGYALDDLEDPFHRYLTPSQTKHPKQSYAGGENGGSDKRNTPPDVSDRKTSVRPKSTGNVSGVSDNGGGEPGEEGGSTGESVDNSDDDLPEIPF